MVAAEVIESVDGPTLRGFVTEVAAEGARVFTDGEPGYRGLPRHAAVAHSTGEYVRKEGKTKIHTNGIESLWSMLKRAHKGVYHNLSAKHLQRYVASFAARQNIRDRHTIDQMALTTMALSGRHITYRTLTS